MEDPIRTHDIRHQRRRTGLNRFNQRASLALAAYRMLTTRQLG
jgi:hypothetical protein